MYVFNHVPGSTIFLILREKAHLVNYLETTSPKKKAQIQEVQ